MSSQEVGATRAEAEAAARRRAIERFASFRREDFAGPLFGEWLGIHCGVVFRVLRSKIYSGRLGALLRDIAPYGEIATHAQEAAGHLETAEDLADEAIIRALRGFRELLLRGRFDPAGPASLETYFTRRCMLRLLDVIEQLHHQRLAEVQCSDEQWAALTRSLAAPPEPDHETRDRIRRAWKLLDNHPNPSLARECLVLFAAGHDKRGIAGRVGVSERTIHRAFAEINKIAGAEVLPEEDAPRTHPAPPPEAS